MTARLTLVLLVVVPAAMAYPWRTPVDWWVLGIAIAVVVLTLAGWRGAFLTTMLGRRLTVWRRNRSAPAPEPGDDVTVLVSVNRADVPLELVSSYVERYGVRCAKVRVTTLDGPGASDTWVSITLRANDNLAALRARSRDLPLYETAQVVGRRLSDQLRELGFEAAVVHDARRPVTDRARETWRGMHDDDGYVAAYEIPVDDALPERLERVRSLGSRATWTALEFGGTAARPTVVALAAIRADEAPKGVAVPGLVARNGRHRALLTALDPRSTATLR